MRGYIFTEKERQAIISFLESKKRDAVINWLVYSLNKNWDRLLADFKILVKFKRFVDAGY